MMWDREVKSLSILQSVEVLKMMYFPSLLLTTFPSFFSFVKMFSRYIFRMGWLIADRLDLNFRITKKYLEMTREEFERYSDNITNKPYSLERYKEFIVNRLTQYPETPAAQMHDWLKEHHPDFPDVSPKTVYNFVMKLRSEYGIPKETAIEASSKQLVDEERPLWEDNTGLKEWLKGLTKKIM